jgi:3-oxoacyl-[acyl-carrier protein] reductase
MDLELKGKVVLVTGGSRGLGSHIAKGFVSEGAIVVGCARSGIDSSLDKEFASSSKNPEVELLQCDVTHEKECRDLIETIASRYGRIDVVICNAGKSASAKPGEETKEDWVKMLDVNLIGASNIVQASKKHLMRTKGVVVCISSICGLEAISGAPITYSAAKSALNSYVLGTARVLAAQGVRINGIAPGNLLFEGSVWEMKREKNRLAVDEMIAREVPLGRFGKAEEVVSATLYLASSKASFITGVILPVDGGQIRS